MTTGSISGADGRRLRILIVSPALPYPPNSGFNIRVYQFVRLLARKHSVSLLAYADRADKGSIEALERICDEVHTVIPPRPLGGKRWAQLASIAAGYSYQRRSYQSPEMQDALRRLASRQPFDVIQVETSPLVAFAFDPRSALVVVEHDIVYELLRRMWETEPSPLRRLYNRIEFAKFRREEVRTWKGVSAIITTSAREEQIVRASAPGTPVLVAPNGVDVEYFQPSDRPPEADSIVMTGFMKTRPNIDGAIFFIKEVLPRVLAKRPTTRFYVVGGEPPDELTALAGPNVVVTGGVPDVRPYVYRSALFVVPLRMGGGTRLKVLEALSMRKPVVSTSIGCEGLDTRHGEHLLVADDPAVFADAVLQLIEDRETAAALAERGRDLVEREYQWKTVVDRVDAYYRQLVQLREREGASV